jgi:PAS domain S-box-containing protein
MGHLPGLAWIKDLEGRYVYANDAAEKAFRTPRAELYGRTDEDVFPPDVAAQFKENDRRALASESGIQTIETLEHEDGVLHHSIVSKFPIPGMDDKAALVGGMAVDITDLVHAEATIRESEERFRQLAEAIPQMVFVAGPDGFVEYRNQRWRNYTGLERADEESMKEVVHPEDLPILVDRWNEASARGSVFEAEYRIRRAKDGKFRWFLNRALPICDAQGTVMRWFGTCTDIDGRKRAEQEQHLLADAGRVLSSSLDYRATLANICKLLVPIFADWCALDLLDRNGQVRHLEVAHVDPAKVEFAREYRRRFPAHPDDRVGLMRVIRTGSPEFYPEVSDEHLAMGARDPEELRLLRELGPRSVIIVPLKARGRPLGALTVVTAESARRYTEEDLHVALELGSRAALAVDNARLFEEAREAVSQREEALNELRANDRRKDEFLAMLAHELRNPLAAIGNAVEFQGESNPNHEQIEWSLEVIGRQVKHLTRLIDDLLDVSRITQGKIQLRKAKIDAFPVLQSALQSVQPSIQERAHQIHASFGAGLLLEADPTRLEQIIVNLLSNAARYTNKGGRIWLTAAREHKEIVIRVRDTGIGIPQEQLNNVFELFIQGDRSLERSAGGLGIGLTLVRKIAELHGGSVTARSDGPGRGSEFIVRLPAAEEPLADRVHVPAQSLQSERPAARILIVDDNIDLARGLAKLLELHGHQVEIAHDGPSCINKAKKARPHFILLDIGLPGMSGYEVALRLRDDDVVKHAVIIAISGYGREEDRKLSKEAGFDYHLVKPIGSDELIKIFDGSRSKGAKR